MKNRNQIEKLAFAAMFLTLAFVLPFFTGQIPQIGSMLCPMHIPVLLCGYLCGGTWGLIVGLIAPVLRSMIFGMPMMFPAAVCMAFELAAYGGVAGLLNRILPQKKWTLYFSLIIAMLVGRFVWGVAMFVCMGFSTTSFGMSAFLTGAFLEAIPGIVIQILLIPMIVSAVRKVEK